MLMWILITICAVVALLMLYAIIMATLFVRSVYRDYCFKEQDRYDRYANRRADSIAGVISCKKSSKKERKELKVNNIMV